MESVNRIPAIEAIRPYPSLAYRSMRDWIERVSHVDLAILIQGESGAGKENVARMIHARSRRREGPFVPVNCTALTETLLEAELFGAVRGAYTGADRDRSGLFRKAHRGTLFLDEIGDMPAEMQVKLLRAIEEKRVRPVGGVSEIDVDVRVLTATHRDLPRRVARGLFREDLYYRLAVLQVHVPPLRERLDDLPQLVEELAGRLRPQIGHENVRLSAGGWNKLRSHSWPGNVRELHAVLARALLRAEGGEIRPRHLETRPTPPARTRPLYSANEPLERVMIEEALFESKQIVARAAARIGWSRQKLYRRMAALDMKSPGGSSGR